MGDAGAVFFAEALQLNDSLTSLDLRFNQVWGNHVRGQK
jgi:hypothetical protein